MLTGIVATEHRRRIRFATATDEQPADRCQRLRPAVARTARRVHPYVRDIPPVLGRPCGFLFELRFVIVEDGSSRSWRCRI